MLRPYCNCLSESCRAVRPWRPAEHTAVWLMFGNRDYCLIMFSYDSSRHEGRGVTASGVVVTSVGTKGLFCELKMLLVCFWLWVL